MDIITLDFETYWDQKYSLTKMSPLAYVMDDRFEAISLSFKINDRTTDVVIGPMNVAHVIKGLALHNRAVCGHNMSGFDAYVLAYRYGVKPKLWMCTLAMARPIHAKDVGLSLKALSEHYGLAAKDNSVLMETKGLRYKDFTADQLARMAAYNKTDTDNTRALFKILARHHSAAEMWQIDALTRARTEPQFVLDIPLLEQTLGVERISKHQSLVRLAQDLGLEVDEEGVDEEALAEAVRDQLASAPKFSSLLERLGVEVPTKPSPTDPTKAIPALAKSDDGMLELCEHPDPIVAAAARARLSVKSTLLETRIEKFIEAGRHAGGLLPVPLRYCGADTTGRDSGEEYSCQNLPRIDPEKPKASDALRRSLCAQPGHKVGVADQSGIELRVNHFLWKVPSSMKLYQANPAKADLYKAFAASLYGKDQSEVVKTERHVGKLSQLGLGFGAGAVTFQRIAKIQGGIDLPLMHEDENVMSSQRIVDRWRGEYSEIVDGWRRCANAIGHIAAGAERAVDPWGMVHTSKHGLHLPSGRIIRYPDLRLEDDGEWPDGRAKRSWFYAHGRHKARLTGPKVDENIVQALARDSVFDAALEFYRLTGLYFKLRVHDELVYVFPDDQAQELLDLLQSLLRTPPKWWPELVVWSEGDIADRYGDAK